MALFKDVVENRYAECAKSDRAVTQEVYRVIDDGTCVLTTLDARKALLALQELIEKHDITNCWSETEYLG